MAVNASMQANPQAPSHGDTITVTYTVTGNDPTECTGLTFAATADDSVFTAAVP